MSATNRPVAPPRTAHFDLGAFLFRIRGTCYGFLDPADLATLAEVDRLRLVLIRWHEGRALVHAQDARAFLDVTEAAGWCVRDVSLPAEDGR